MTHNVKVFRSLFYRPTPRISLLPFTLQGLSKMSPTSMKVTLKQLIIGAKSTFAECFQMEFRLGSHHVRDSDFAEGVRALLIDKDNQPKWKPPTLAEVTSDRVDSFFKPVPGVEDMDL